jgi:hypothetical protein
LGRPSRAPHTAIYGDDLLLSFAISPYLDLRVALSPYEDTFGLSDSGTEFHFGKPLASFVAARAFIRAE